MICLSVEGAYIENGSRKIEYSQTSCTSLDKVRQSSVSFSCVELSLCLVSPCGSAVERQSLVRVLSPSCARPVADV